jgi:signal transduction histidine kinase
MGLINLIKLEQDEEKLRSYIDLQEKSVTKLDHFIKDIINLSRNTRIAVSVEEIDYNELLEGIFARFDQHPSGEGITKRLFIDGDVPFYSDRQRIEVMLTNLVSNSIKFYNSHQDDPYVHVYITCGPEESVIEVRDNGIGIAAEYLNKIYSMFFRAAKDNPGSGLGLYIVKEIISKIKGQISVRSKLREGTTFTLKIPNLVKRYEATPKIF